MKVTDYLNNSYASAKEMCDFYNIPVRVYLDRIRRGWDKKKALLTPISTNLKVNLIPEEERTDHKGIVYDSIKIMCETYGISQSTYGKRIESGWSKEKALTYKIRATHKETKDHKNIRYKSIKEMCNAYNITSEVYKSRKQMGWCLKDILETPIGVSTREKVFIDPYGNNFNDLQSMCDYYHVTRSFYYNKKKQGCCLKECLNITPSLNTQTRNLTCIDGLVIIRYLYTGLNNDLYFTCKYNNKECILSKQEILERY